jgi:hypothetical protein
VFGTNKGELIIAVGFIRSGLDQVEMATPPLADHFTFRVGHVDDVATIAANNIAMAKVSAVTLLVAVVLHLQCSCS